MYEYTKEEKAYQKIQTDVINYCANLHHYSYLSYEKAKTYIKTLYPELSCQQYERLIKAVCNFIQV